MRKFAAVIVMCFTIVALSSCGSDTRDQKSVQQQVQKQVSTRGLGYIPKNNVEFNNYNRAQKLYDSPNTIIWCSAFPPGANQPIITTPIQGKLTSSSVSLLPNTQVRAYSSDDYGTYSPEVKSVDGMYHGSPPPYRYGFTPGGQYVDFSNATLVCTTALTKFQREKTVVVTEVDSQASSATSAAEKALKNGDKAGAQKALSALGSQ